jgi:hypothetical protein
VGRSVAQGNNAECATAFQAPKRIELASLIDNTGLAVGGDVLCTEAATARPELEVQTGKPRASSAALGFLPDNAIKSPVTI